MDNLRNKVKQLKEEYPIGTRVKLIYMEDEQAPPKGTLGTVVGVEIRFEKENINSMSGDGELMLSILASFAQEESRSLSNNIKWRIIKNFEKGIPNGRFRIYGYKWQGDTLVIIPEEAKIVKRIYSEYLSGKSRTQIEKMFAKEGLTTRAGYKWVDSNIRSILTNIHYTGNLLLQKEYKVDPISKKTRKNRGELPQYFVENAKRYIQLSLKHEYASENGTDLNETLPKMSPLNPQYRTKKRVVFKKISDLVEKFKGIGGEL